VAVFDLGGEKQSCPDMYRKLCGGNGRKEGGISQRATQSQRCGKEIRMEIIFGAQIKGKKAKSRDTCSA